MNSQQTDTSDTSLLEQKWEQLNFPEKELCFIKDGQQLTLKATPFTEERSLMAVDLETIETVIAALAEKFKEVENRAKELDEEWNNAEDKIKIASKISVFKSYLQQANALGNYLPILENINQKEKHIADLYAANYAIRLQLAEKAESLKESTDWRNATDEFRTLIEELKTAPIVEKHKHDEIWNRIEEAKNYFYQRKRAFQEDLEIEMMNNLDLKLELCEKAEILEKSEDWRAATDALKDLMEKWKTIGRVASSEKNDELWQRFVGAHNNFYERKKKHFAVISEEQEKNYALKLALVEKAESLQDKEDWKETTEQFAALDKEWKSIGRVPKEKTDELWNRLRAAKDTFFEAKRRNFQELKVNLEDNYARKSALLERVKAIKNSENWRETTIEFNDLMAEWKTIGHVPREYGDTLWEQFIAARKYFFDRKDAHREKRNKEFAGKLQGRLEQTKAFLDKIEEEYKDDLAKIEEFKESLNNISGEGAKDKELKQHLASLINNIERKLPNKKNKIEDVKKQYEELLQKSEGSNKAEEQ